MIEPRSLIWLASLGAALLPITTGGPALVGQDSDALARSYLEVVAESCLPCHGPRSDEKKAVKHWPDALDVAATLATENMVTPGSPEDSDLWLVVDDREMPPADWDGEPLDEDRRAALRAWILAGAPLPSAQQLSEVRARSGAAAEIVQPTPTGLRARLLRYAGRRHPMLVHFPIALLIAAALAELISMRRDSPGIAAARRFCLLLGVGAGVLAASAGWIAGNSAVHSSTLTQHRWMGISSVVLAIITSICMELRERREDPGRLGRCARPLLFLTAALVGTSAHWGAVLSFGEAYFRF